MPLSKPSENARTGKLMGLAMAVALAVSFLGGCAVGLNQATETKVEEFKVEIQKLNANLESYKKEVQMLNDSFDKIAKYIRKFWEELHPEDK